MTVGTVPFSVEWALHGVAPGEWAAYRLLACSTGVLSRGNFLEAVSRYSPGTPETLPQVSVSYLARADKKEDGSYLALAIHELTKVSPEDGDERQDVFTRYFCAPYAQLSADAISYQAMYQAFLPIQLPKGDGPVIAVTVDATSPLMPPDDTLALQVAALLLTGPVCVLGADGASLRDRLGFIDSVMTLLPYGMRSRMSATTWIRSTQRSHRFRLFFSDAPRSTGGQDHVVRWRHPELTQIPQEDSYAYAYLAWLEDRVQQPVRRLCELTDEFGFSSRQVLQMLERIGIAGPQPGLDFATDGQDRYPTEAERILLACVARMMTPDLDGLESALAALRSCADAADLPENDRARYQAIIVRHDLFWADLPVGRLRYQLYGALLNLAFGMPLSYAGYCQLEDCLSVRSPADPSPHQALAEAIEQGGTADTRVTAIILSCLGERKLASWFHSGQAAIEELIALPAADWCCSLHARMAFQVTFAFISTLPGQYGRRAVRSTLGNHGYLALALQARYPDDGEYQVEMIARCLRAAHGDTGLDQHAITEIMKGAGGPPTAALLAAVLLHLTDPADAKLAQELYLGGPLALSNLAVTTRDHLAKRLPQQPSQKTPGPSHGAARLRSRTGQLAVPTPAPRQAANTPEVLAADPVHRKRGWRFVPLVYWHDLDARNAANYRQPARERPLCCTSPATNSDLTHNEIRKIAHMPHRSGI